jgi:hypothetical protein
MNPKVKCSTGSTAAEASTIRNHYGRLEKLIQSMQFNPNLQANQQKTSAYLMTKTITIG